MNQRRAKKNFASVRLVVARKHALVKKDKFGDQLLQFKDGDYIRITGQAVSMAMLVAATRNLPKVIGMSRLPISPNLSRSNPTMLTLMSGVVLRNLAKAIGAVHWPITIKRLHSIPMMLTPTTSAAI
jgi:hypothetical protein